MHTREVELESNHLLASRYRIDRVIGAGGFGRVYAATDVTNGTLVAVKVLTPDGEPYQPVTRARFRREIALVADLRSPYTVRLLDHGETPDGLLYAVFEFVSGEDLSAVLARCPTLAPNIVEHVLRQLLGSLSEAHRVGVLHRDIKPQNVRVCRRGRPLASQAARLRDRTPDWRWGGRAHAHRGVGGHAATCRRNS